MDSCWPTKASSRPSDACVGPQGPRRLPKGEGLADPGRAGGMSDEATIVNVIRVQVEGAAALQQCTCAIRNPPEARTTWDQLAEHIVAMVTDGLMIDVR